MDKKNYILLFLICSLNGLFAQTTDLGIYHEVANEFLKSIDEETYIFPDLRCGGFFIGDQTPYFLKENSYYDESRNDIMKDILRYNENQKKVDVRIDFSKISNDNISPHSDEFFEFIKLIARKAKGEKIDNLEPVNEFPELIFSIYLSENKSYALINYLKYDSEWGTTDIPDNKYVLIKNTIDGWKTLKHFNVIN